MVLEDGGQEDLGSGTPSALPQGTEGEDRDRARNSKGQLRTVEACTASHVLHWFPHVKRYVGLQGCHWDNELSR